MGSCLKVDDPLIQCGTKLGFRTRAHATRHFAQAFPRDRRRGQLSAYCCPHCGLWHVGHAPGSLSRAMNGKPWIKKARRWETARQEGD